MMAASCEYQKGQYVGIGWRPRLELPLPSSWYVLRVQPGRDGKVMKAFSDRDVSAYSPTIVRSIDRRSGADARRPHLGRKVVRPMLPGLIFIPDFDTGNAAIGTVDHLEGWLQIGDRDSFGDFVPRLATLSADDMQTLRSIADAFNSTSRKVTVSQMVRITSGRFADFVGKVERLDSGGRLKVFIAALMSGASVIVDEAQVEPVSQRSARATARRPKRKRGCSSA